MIFDIDATIVVMFLLFTFIIGIGNGRGAKTINEYALGNRNFSTGMLVATLVASILGGGSFSNSLSKTYSQGLYYVIPSLGMIVSYLIIGYILVPRMGEFLGKTSIAEAMGDLYGKKVRVITAIAGTIGSIGGIAIQFQVFGSILVYFSGISSLQGVIIAASIVTLYSAFGGIKAVTFTDFLQFFTFGLAVPIVGVMIWNHAYYHGLSFDNAISSSNFDITEIFNISNPRFSSVIALLFYFMIPSMRPDIFQRISMGSSILQVKRAFVICSIIMLIISIALKWIPFLIFNMDPTLNPKTLLGYMIETYTFTGFKGLLIAGILALAMSTADSVINSSSVLFANDICKPLNIADNKELLLSKLFAFVVGIAGVILAVNAKDLLSIILGVNAFYMPIVTVPMIMTILGFRSSTKSVLIGMTAGGITVMTWKYVLNIDADPIAFAMLVNLIFLVGSHYLLKQEGGWVGIKDKASLEAMRNEAIKRREAEMTKFGEPRYSGFLAFCRRHAPAEELSYIYLGVYMIIYAITTMYLTKIELSGYQTNYFILVMYQMVLVSGILLIMYPIWPDIISSKNKKNLASVLWVFIVFLMLIVFNTFFAITAQFSGLQLSIFTVNLLIVSVLVGWRSAMWMIFFGFWIGIILHALYNPYYTLDMSIGSPGFIMSYVSFIVGATMMLFVKPNQEYLEKTENEITHLDHELVDLTGKLRFFNQKISDQEQEIERLGATAQRILNNVNHELRLPIGNVVNFSDMLHETLQKSDNELLKDLSEEVLKNSTRVSSMILNMLDLVVLKAEKVDLQKTTINFSELVENRVRHCRKAYLQGKKIDFELSMQPEILIAVDPNYIRQMVDNIVNNAITYSNEGVIRVTTFQENREVTLIIEDQGIGIPEKEIFDIFQPFKMGSKTQSKAEGRGIGLALCKAVAEAHGGKIEAKSDGIKGATFIVSLPI